jgi:hypothetical protein
MESEEKQSWAEKTIKINPIPLELPHNTQQKITNFTLHQKLLKHTAEFTGHTMYVIFFPPQCHIEKELLHILPKYVPKNLLTCTKVLHVKCLSFLSNFNKNFTQSKIFNKTPNTLFKIPRLKHELVLLFPLTLRGNSQYFKPFNTAGV